MLSSTLNLISKKLAAALLFTFLITACKKEETVQPNPGNPSQPDVVKTQFSAGEFPLAENAGETSYELRFSTTTSRQESLVLSFTSATAQYGVDFTTLPAAENGKIQLNVEANKQLASFKVIPVNNNIKNGPRELQFTITAEGSIKPEGRTNAKIILADDDAATKASVAFAQANGSVIEGQTEGYAAQLHITPMAFANGFIDVAYISANAVYGTHFTTEPALTNGKIRVPVAQNQSTVSFKIKPVNDAIQTPLRAITFSIGTTSEDLEPGMQNQLNFSIGDDDHPLPTGTPVQTIRNLFTGTDTYLWTQTFVAGTVTSINDNIEASVVYVQDGTGGIAIRFTSSNTLQYGERVIINLQGSVLHDNNGVLELKNVDTRGVIKAGWEIYVIPTYTLEEFFNLPGIKEGKLISLRNLRFTEANGTATLEGNRTITDGVRTAVVKTESFASFKNRIIPQGAVSVIGIVVERYGEYIILPLNGESIY
jgi:Family of unknown function (DUF5689)